MKENDYHRFWMVWRVGGSYPTRAHYDYTEAEREVKRLASENPTATFALLESVVFYKVPALEPRMILPVPEKLDGEPGSSIPEYLLGVDES